MSLVDLALSFVFKISFSVLSLLASALFLWLPAPLASVTPLAWLLSHQLNETQQAQAKAWAGDCLEPAYQKLASRGVTLTWSDTLPFPGAVVGDELVFLTTPDRVNCEVRGQEMITQVIEDLSQVKTPSGVPLLSIWQDEFNLSATEVARFLVLREVQSQLFPADRLSISYSNAIGIP